MTTYVSRNCDHKRIGELAMAMPCGELLLVEPDAVDKFKHHYLLALHGGDFAVVYGQGQANRRYAAIVKEAFGKLVKGEVVTNRYI